MSEWSLVYEAYEPACETHREALCALGNGYFVTRGAAPDCSADGLHYPGSYVAGGYNRLVSRVAQRDVENEDLVNLPNWLVLRIRIDDDAWLSPDQVELLSYRQELDLKAGLLQRRLRLRDRAGRITRWDERRLVSMADRHLAALELQVTPEDWAGRLSICAGIDGGVINDGVARYRGLSSRHLETVATGEQDACTVFLQARLNQARVEIAEVVRTCLWLNREPIGPPRRTEQSADRIAQEIALDVRADDEVSIEKVLALFTSRDRAISEAGLAARHSAARAPRFEDLLGSTAAFGDSCGSSATSTSPPRRIGRSSPSCGSIFSISCRACRTTPSISTSACRRAAGTAKRIAGTSSGTSCSSCPISTCACLRSAGRC